MTDMIRGFNGEIQDYFDTSKENTAQAEEPAEEHLEKGAKKYRIAVMGASGVGKTTFFASYFYSTLRKSNGTLRITPSESAAPTIRTIINAFFRDRLPVGGTVERLHIGINVRNLNGQDMYISIDDLPGGFTQTVEDWRNSKVMRDLKEADGILFFISAEDLMNDPEKVMDDNDAFSLAIEEIRKGSRSGGRADIPIKFLYTKCDAIPKGITREELVNKNPKLTNDAKEKYSNLFFSVGHNVSAYDVSSMGKWKGPKTPPSEGEYAPHNVIEPMEELIREMQASKSRFGKMKLAEYVKDLAFALVLLYVLTVGVLWGFDYCRLESAGRDVIGAVNSSNLAEARRIADTFSARWMPPKLLLPEFIRFDDMDFYERYESAMYARVLPDITNLDVNIVPSNPALFNPAAERVENYVINTEFSQVNAQNYENVRQYVPYYEAGKIILASDTELSAAGSSQEFFKTVNSALTGASDFPQWQEQLTVKIDRAVRAWALSVSDSAEIEDLRRAITNAEQLAAHTNMPIELADFLLNQKSQFELWLTVAWEKRGNEWLQEASQMDLKDAVQLLASRKSESGLPREIIERLDNALNQRYNVFVSDKLNNADEGELQNILRDYPDMPPTQMTRIEGRLLAMNKEKYDGIVADLNQKNSLDDLIDMTEEIQDAQKQFPEISNEAQGALARVLEMEFNTMRSSLGTYGSKGDFDAAKQTLDRFFEELRPKLSPLLLNLPNGGAILNTIDAVSTEESAKLFQAHFKFCQSEFNRIRSIRDARDIASVIDKLKLFNDRWAAPTNERTQVDQVITFLEAVMSGPRVTLIISDGDFANFSGMTDTPDVFVEILNGDNLLAKTVTVADKTNPSFNLQYGFTWRPDVVFTFAAWEEDTMSNDEIFRKPVYATGLFGYEELNGNVSSGGNSINIRLEHRIPECPWR